MPDRTDASSNFRNFSLRRTRRMAPGKVSNSTRTTMASYTVPACLCNYDGLANHVLKEQCRDAIPKCHDALPNRLVHEEKPSHGNVRHEHQKISYHARTTATKRHLNTQSMHATQNKPPMQRQRLRAQRQDTHKRTTKAEYNKPCKLYSTSTRHSGKPNLKPYQAEADLNAQGTNA